MRVGSLFAGIGGFDLAAERAGMEVVWQSEIDRHASAVLAHHWPEVPNYGDIHDIRVGVQPDSGREPTPPRDLPAVEVGTSGEHRPSRVSSQGAPDGIPAVDVLTGGFPCQDYSVAGNRGGLAGDRGALWWEYLRLITRLRPTWVVAENVPGLLSSRGGADFATIVGSLTECGYGVAWAVLDAQYFGVAQRRRRVFIVGHSGGEPRPEILALGEGLYGHPEPSREQGSGSTRATPFGIREDREVSPALTTPTGGLSAKQNQYTFVIDVSRRDRVGVEEGDVAPTLQQQMGTGGNNVATLAFAQNQRDEIGDRAGALAAEPGMKQQTYVARTAQTGANEIGVLDDGTAHVLDGTGSEALVTPSAVRRLTPLECERLQGFPDGWTDMPGNSDTQRYRQLGNAVAVPVVEWIMHRIKTAVLRNPGSLEESEQHPDDKGD